MDVIITIILILLFLCLLVHFLPTNNNQANLFDTLPLEHQIMLNTVYVYEKVQAYVVDDDVLHKKMYTYELIGTTDIDKKCYTFTIDINDDVAKQLAAIRSAGIDRTFRIDAFMSVGEVKQLIKKDILLCDVFSEYL